MKLRLIALAVAAAVVAGCSSSQPSTPSAPAAPSQAASAGAAGGGCALEYAKICQAFFDQPSFLIGGAESNRSTLEQNATRHPDIELPLKMPSGDPIITINCQIDTQTHRIAQARMVPGPAMSDSAANYLKKQGWCSDQNPDYAKLLTVAGNPLVAGAQ